MNTMEAIAKVNLNQQALLPSIKQHQRLSFARPLSSISVRAPFPPSSLPFPLKLKSLRVFPCISMNAVSSASPPGPSQNSPKPKSQPLNPFPFSLLKTALIASVTATVFFARFNFRSSVGFAISAPPPSTVETAENDAITMAEKRNESALEEHLQSNPDDVDALKTLMEIKFKSRNMVEAIGVIEQLIRLEPNEVEWPLFKAHMHCYAGEVEAAKIGFNEILEKDPLRVEAYHGLVTTALGDDWKIELTEIEKRMEKGMEVCKKQKKKDELRDFKLLLAQIRVIQGRIDEALSIYQELVKEEPRDFRPYLCQGFIYNSLGKKNEAEKCLEKYRRLVPKGHPYANLVDEVVGRGELYSQKKNERAESRS